MSPARDILEARLTAEELGLTAPPAALLEALAGQIDPVILDSTALHHQYGRYSVLACRPLQVVTLRDGALRDGAGCVLAAGDDQAIRRALGEAFGRVRLAGALPPVPYTPGWIGYAGYELARYIERLGERAVRDTAQPDLRFAFYDAVLVCDLVGQRWHVVNLVFDEPPPGAGQAGRILRTIAMDARFEAAATPPAATEDADATVAPGVEDAESNFTAAEYERAVARAVEYIAAGDIFQVNLSQRFTVRSVPAPLEIYRALRRRNPAWYSAYMCFQSDGRRVAILSSSPELFLRVRGREVLTRPIKGTRPRIGVPEADAAAAAELLASEKDNAELAMIIDLLRNDLGRVCRFGTIRVAEPVRLETHPTVFHLVGTVSGRLRDGVGPVELLEATFPGGSITGAPKIRAMEIIDELEDVARGVYTGCIGHIGVDGACEWNIAIRTIVCDGSVAYVQAGGGIVADSSPQAEYHETLDKARALMEAIAEVRPAPVRR